MEGLVNWLMVFMRASAMLSIFPIFSIENFPVRFRLALGALLAWFVSVTLTPTSLGSEPLLTIFGVMAMEVFVGLAMGFSGKMVFYALDIVGALLSTEIGLALAQNLNPLSGGQKPVLANAIYYLAAMLWLALDLHHQFLMGFMRSYDYLPVGAAGINPALITEIIGRTNGLFVLALRMSAPVMAVIFMVTLVFAVLGRAVPQMNVFVLSFGAKLFTGMLVFGMTVHLMAQHISTYLHGLPEDMMRLVVMMRAAP